ncbi:transcription factor cwo isoform X2 [Onthophagus taurus]|uniref:transcription factor cwo isoform X2 n=1 Tax=Onthophagus taurus TaxID=166361 RepID=UPI0039BE345D
MNHGYWEENAATQHVKYESGDSVPCCEVLAPYSDSESTYGVRLTKNRVSRQDPLSHRIIEKRRRDRMNNCLADLSRLIPAEYLKKGRGRVEKTEIIEMAIKHMKHLQHLDDYRLGYQECMSETMRFLVEVEGRFPREPFCVRLLGHLQQHCDSLTKQAPVEDASKVEPNNNHIEEELPQHHEKHTETYKYKTNIKLRFNQDLQHARRNSTASIENHRFSFQNEITKERNKVWLINHQEKKNVYCLDMFKIMDDPKIYHRKIVFTGFH